MQPNNQPGSNHKLLIVVVVGLVIVVGGYLALLATRPTNKTTAPKTINTAAIAPARITITGSGFIPATVTIKVNQAVTWTNNDSQAHQVSSDPYPTDNALAGFNDRQALTQNDSFSFIFNQAGTYSYHDELNPYKFKGVVVVKG